MPDEFSFPDDSDGGDEAASEGRSPAESGTRGDGRGGDADGDVDEVRRQASDEREGERPDDDSPLGSLARSVRERRARRADADRADPTADLADGGGDATEAAPEELFESVAVDDLNAESVWASLEAENAGSTQAAGVGTDDAHSGVAVGEEGSDPLPFEADVERIDRDDPGAVRTDHLVPKKKFCQQCQYFSAPPEVACGHEGTDIVEVADTEHFRVRGCPMVEESER